MAMCIGGSASGETMTQAKHNRPWLMLVMEYAGDTTLHGIRFLTQPTKFLVRRFNHLTLVTLLQNNIQILEQMYEL